MNKNVDKKSVIEDIKKLQKKSEEYPRSYKEIAEKYGITYTYVYQLRHRYIK